MYANRDTMCADACTLCPGMNIVDVCSAEVCERFGVVEGNGSFAASARNFCLAKCPSAEAA